MQSPDCQRLAHILDYCVEIEKTIARYGADFFALTMTQITSGPSRSPFCRLAS